MTVTVHRRLAPTDEGAAVRALQADGLRPHAWANGPGDTYGWHDHPYTKVLCCVHGSITFHTHDGDIRLAAGDRMELPAGTAHAATVGGDGVTCVEAPR